MSTLYYKEGDDSPSLAVSLKNPDGTVATLSGAEVDIRITKARGGENVVNSDASIQNADEGSVSYDPSDTDFDEPGRYRVEFEVTYDDGSVETFPNKGYHTLLVGRNMER